jgi:2-(1,2-epoxy-1,2-dihydrophenyl)acetyl-CoA isomerase
MSDAVLYDVADAVATITLNRPDALNAADDALKVDLAEALERATDDAGVRAVVLTGAGRAFCVGQDLKELEPLYASGDPELAGVVAKFNRVISLLTGLPKPVIAGVNGVAAGAGASLAFACDFRVVSDKASFAMAFSGIGLVPDSGASWTLPKLVGTSKAMEMLTLGGKVGADDALRIGLATKVVPADVFDDELRAFAGALAAGPTLAFGLTKRLVSSAATSTLYEALDLEEELQSVAGRSYDHGAAIQAFLAKQPTAFEGR